MRFLSLLRRLCDLPRRMALRTRAGSPFRRARLGLESLEDRQLLNNQSLGALAPFALLGKALYLTTAPRPLRVIAPPPPQISSTPPPPTQPPPTQPPIDPPSPARIAGCVYADLNNNGQKDAGEAGIAGVLVTLNGVDYQGNAVNQTVTTGAAGDFVFANLAPGTYHLTEAQPAGWLDGRDAVGTAGGTLSDDHIAAIALAAGANATDYKFGELPPAALAGCVYHDANNNGAQDPGEAGIAGALVTLTGTDDRGQAVMLSQVTGADGAYAFAGLRAGTYRLTETQPQGWLDGKDTAGTAGGMVADDLVDAVFLGAGVNATGYKFGEVRAASLAGCVYHDVNNNGVQDPGEAGIGGVLVSLTGTDDRGQPVSTSQATAADGSFAFAGLRPGTYRLTEAQPAGWLDGQDAVGTAGGVLANDQVSGIVLGSGISAAGYKFGEVQAAGISGCVYHDANNNGVQDAGEAGIAGAVVTLTGTDDLGQAVSRTQTTGADGSFAFTGLRPGTYRLNEAQPAGWLDGQDSAGSAGGSVTDDQIAGIVLGANGAAGGYKFGEIRPGSLAGCVYHDANGNGRQDAGEAGVAGALVTLTGTDDRGQAVSRSATTGADGLFAFTGLRPGTYRLAETQPQGWLDGQDAAGTAGGTAGNDVIDAVVLAAGADATGYKFGEVQATGISGCVYHDANNNGVQDAGEAGIAGVRVTLTGTDDRGQAVSRAATTAADGSFAFTGLRPGTYALAETQPAGWLDGKDAAGGAGGTAGNDAVTGIVLGPGAAAAGYKFGELAPASLKGFVYEDANNDGVKQDGELGIAGVTVVLTGTDDRGQAVSLTLTTAADGSYCFQVLRPGTYQVAETQPPDYFDGKDRVGTQGGTVQNDRFTNVVLASGVVGQDNNFGEILGASVSGCVYLDANDNGILEADELPLPGVTVTLSGTDDLGRAVSRQVVTGLDGLFRFDGLRPGSYQLREVQPAGFVDGKEGLGSLGGTQGNDVFFLTLAPGDVGFDYKFAETLPPLPPQVVPPPPPPPAPPPPPPVVAPTYDYLSKQLYLTTNRHMLRG